MLDNFTKDVISAFAKVRPEYAPPHKTIFAQAKKHGLTVSIDGEKESARKDWCDDLMEEGVDDDIVVEVFAGTKRAGTVTFRWEDEREVKVKNVKNNSK